MPYFVFYPTSVKRYDSPDATHFSNSKKAYDEVLMIVDRVGDVTKLSPNLKVKFADLLTLALAEANQVQPLYLQKAHLDYPNPTKISMNTLILKKCRSMARQPLTMIHQKTSIDYF